jgi:hypothetical protein
MPHRWMSLALVSGVVVACGGSGGPLQLGRNGEGLPEAGSGVDGSLDADTNPGADHADGSVTNDATTGDGAQGGDTMDASPGKPPGLDAAADAAHANEAGPGPSSCPAVMEATGVFVDGASGVDDATHGGAAGACAYKTISYALAHFDRAITVGAGTYSAATGETFPLVLTGRQTVTCTSYSTTTIKGQAAYQASRASVVLSGSVNQLSHCGVVGDDTTGSCVLVTSSGSGNGHTLDYDEASLCGGAAYRIEGDNVLVQGSWGHDSEHGIVWAGTGQTGQMLNNLLWNNTGDDITCSSPDNGVTGSGNDDSYNDPLTCSTCGNCDFNN